MTPRVTRLSRSLLQIVQTVAPSAAILPIADARTWLRLDTIDVGAVDAALDTEIAALVLAALDYVQRETGLVLLQSTWRISWSAWPEDRVLRLPLAPVTAVSSIAYLDSLGVERTLPVGDYAAALDGDYPVVALLPTRCWPALYDVPAAVRMVVTAGNSVASAAPQSAILAIRLLLAHWFENRAAVVAGVPVAEVPVAVPALLAQLRRAVL